MAIYINRLVPGFINAKTKEFPRQTMTFACDAIGIIIGGILGISPLTVFIESAAGIREGGRTGITALTVSAWFFLSFFFNPIIASIPPYASGPALVLVSMCTLSMVWCVGRRRGGARAPHGRLPAHHA